MKITRLMVNGFGIHHDRSFPLEQPITLFYGENEAGKSTLMNFIRSVLFGFPNRSRPQDRYEPVRGGVHGGALLLTDLPDMRYAEVRVERLNGAAGSGGGSRKQASAGIVRITLPDGSEAGEAWLARQLEGMNEELFNSLFAFGLGELQELGTLQRDEIGGYLYSAGLGARGSAIIDAERRLQQSMEQIYKLRGKNQEIGRLLIELEETETALRRSREEIGSYQALLDKRSALEHEVSSLEAELMEREARQDWLDACLQAREHWTRKLELESEQSGLPDMPIFPEDALSRYESLSKEEDWLLDSFGQGERERDRLQTVVEQGNAPLALLDKDAELNALLERAAVYEDNLAAITELQMQLALFTGQLEQLAGTIDSGWEAERFASGVALSDREAARTFRDSLSAARRQLERSDAQWTAAKERLREAAKASEESRSAFDWQVEQLEREFGWMKPLLPDEWKAAALRVRRDYEQCNRKQAELEHAKVRKADNAQHVRALAEARRLAVQRETPISQPDARSTAAASLVRGFMWATGAAGTASVLLLLWMKQPVGAGLAAIAASSALLYEGWRLAALLRKAPSARKAENEEGFPGRRSRHGRNRTAQNRRHFSSCAADSALEETDNAASEEEKLNQHREAFASSASDEAETRDALERQIAALTREIGQLKDRIGLSLQAMLYDGEAAAARFGVDGLQAGAVDSKFQYDGGSALPHDDDSIPSLRRNTASAPSAPSVPSASPAASTAPADPLHWLTAETVDQLLQAADRFEAAHRESSQQERRAAELDSAVRVAADLLAEAEERYREHRDELERTEQSWRGFLREQRLREELSPEAALDLFRSIEQGNELFRQRARQQDRLAALQEHNRLFEEQANSLLALFGSEAAYGHRLAVGLKRLKEEASRLQGLREDARRSSEALAALVLQLAAERAQLERVRSKLAALLAEAGAADEAELRLRSRQFERLRELAAESRHADALLAALVGRERLGKLLDELAAGEPGALERESLACRDERSRLEQRLTALKEERGRLAGELARLQDGAAHAERLQLAAEQTAALQREAARWAQLALTAALFRKSRDVYERERQPGVLRRASQYFADITKGQYTKVLVPLGEKRMLALRADGEAVDSSFLSRGTAEQLYLSMRFALAAEYSQRASLPLVMDDIFVNFDRNRLVNTLGLLDTVAKTHQILLFTCHEHVRRAVAECLPQAGIIQI